VALPRLFVVVDPVREHVWLHWGRTLSEAAAGLAARADREGLAIIAHEGGWSRDLAPGEQAEVDAVLARTSPGVHGG
jgi:hypothetical protein